jgi:DNA-binding transcriptional MerR regulator
VQPTSRTEGGFRLYSEADLQRLLVIRRMKPLGFTLEEMRTVLRIVDALPCSSGQDRRDLLEDLRTFIVMAHERRAKLARQLDMADEFISILVSHEEDPAGLADVLTSDLPGDPAGVEETPAVS